MQKVIVTTLIFLTIPIINLMPAQANDAIRSCLIPDRRVRNTILEVYKDPDAWKDSDPNRPTMIFQIGEEIDWGVAIGNSKGYETRVVVLLKSGKCKGRRIVDQYGFEPFVPFDVAVSMELKHIDWHAKNVVNRDLGDQPEEDIDIAAEIGHGCEPWTQAMAEARRIRGLGLDGCSVRKNKLERFWKWENQKNNQQ